MSNKYTKEIIRVPMKGIVLEDNIWEFGKPKEKAKINIPSILPLQEPSEIVKKIEKSSNSRIVNKIVEQTLNYIEMYLPDSIYTYPTEYEVENENCTLIGASKENPMRTEENGETKEGLVRLVKKNTQLMLFIIDGIVIESNIRILGKFDDFDPEKNEADESKLAGYVPKETIKSAKRKTVSDNKGTGSRIPEGYRKVSTEGKSQSPSKITKISALR